MALLRGECGMTDYDDLTIEELMKLATNKLREDDD